MEPQQNQLYFRLTEAADHRAFLRLWMAEGGRGGGSVSFGEAARRFGFASRAFLSDVLRGKKSLSPKSLQAIRRGLSHLPDVVVRSFVLLAYVDEEGLRPPSMTGAKAQEVLAKVRQRARRLFVEDLMGQQQRDVDGLVTQMAFHLCFAALQVGETGESVAGVSAKTGLPPRAAAALLEHMVQAGFVACVSGGEAAERRYRALDAHRVLEHMASPEAFHTFVVNWLSQVLRKTAAERPKPEDLYNVSTFSVKSADRPALRRRLIEAVDSIVEEFEASPGDEIVSLSVVYTGH